MATPTNLTRRAVLSTGAVALAALPLAGCGLEPGAEATAAAQDVDLVRTALAEEADFEQMCQDVRRRNLRRAAQLDVVIVGQRAHIDALTDLLESPTASGSSSTAFSGESAAAVSRTAAKLHQRRLVDSQAALAGALAQLFASMAASHAVTAQYWRAR